MEEPMIYRMQITTVVAVTQEYRVAADGEQAVRNYDWTNSEEIRDQIRVEGGGDYDLREIVIDSVVLVGPSGRLDIDIRED
jgi:hypothetical protein